MTAKPEVPWSEARESFIALASKWTGGKIAATHSDMELHGSQWVVDLAAKELRALVVKLDEIAAQRALGGK